MKDEMFLQLHRKNHRFVKRRIRCVLMLGEKCQKCGFDEHFTALQFHHKNPKEKLYEIAVLINTMDDMDFENYGIPEILKCELLCSNCHDALHHGEGWPDIL